MLFYVNGCANINRELKAIPKSDEYNCDHKMQYLTLPVDTDAETSTDDTLSSFREDIYDGLSFSSEKPKTKVADQCYWGFDSSSSNIPILSFESFDDLLLCNPPPPPFQPATYDEDAYEFGITSCGDGDGIKPFASFELACIYDPASHEYQTIINDSSINEKLYQLSLTSKPAPDEYASCVGWSSFITKVKDYIKIMRSSYQIRS